MPRATIGGERTYQSNVPYIPCGNPVRRDQSQTSSQFPQYGHKKPPISQLPGKIGNHKQPPQNLKDPKAKAFLSAFQASFQALFANEEASNDNNDEEDKDSPRLDNCDVNDDNKDLHGFFSMVGSLKDYIVSSLVLTSAFSFVKSNPASLSAFSSLFLGAPWVLLNPFNMEFLS
jgi:hypothetical protein